MGALVRDSLNRYQEVIERKRATVMVLLQINSGKSGETNDRKPSKVVRFSLFIIFYVAQITEMWAL